MTKKPLVLIAVGAICVASGIVGVSQTQAPARSARVTPIGQPRVMMLPSLIGWASQAGLKAVIIMKL